MVTILGSVAPPFRCVVQRLQCRDLFDIHRPFVEEGVDVANAWAQFETKASHRDIDPGLFADRWAGRMEQYGNGWDTEMRRYTSAIPYFEKIEREVEMALRPLDVI